MAKREVYERQFQWGGKSHPFDLCEINKVMEHLARRSYSSDNSKSISAVVPPRFREAFGDSVAVVYAEGETAAYYFRKLWPNGQQLYTPFVATLSNDYFFTEDHRVLQLVLLTVAGEQEWPVDCLFDSLMKCVDLDRESVAKRTEQLVKQYPQLNGQTVYTGRFKEEGQAGISQISVDMIAEQALSGGGYNVLLSPADAMKILD
jgi:hypothetical protein